MIVCGIGMGHIWNVICMEYVRNVDGMCVCVCVWNMHGVCEMYGNMCGIYIYIYIYMDLEYVCNMSGVCIYIYIYIYLRKICMEYVLNMCGMCMECVRHIYGWDMCAYL